MGRPAATPLREIQAVLEQVERAWAASDAPTELLSDWLAETRTLVRQHGLNWTKEECDEVKRELKLFAEDLKRNPGRYAFEASSVAYNTELATEHFPQLNSLWDESNDADAPPAHAGGWALRSHTHVKRSQRNTTPGDRTHPDIERSLPHSARHPEQYKLERLRPF
ncbi:hypothetical protein JCM10449v2_005255 [Rhodotorula kratochvilovae]